MTRGVYALIIHNEKKQYLKIGKLGTYLFLKGYYVYVGSALGKTATNLENRLNRHLSLTKKLFWHIDFLLNANYIKIVAIIYANTTENLECHLASVISQLKGAEILVPGFGASDCTGKCGAHLFYFMIEKDSLINLIKTAFSEINLNPISKKINSAHNELIH